MEYTENMEVLNRAKIIDSQSVYEDLVENHEYDLCFDRNTPDELFGNVFPGVYIDTDKVDVPVIWKPYEIRMIDGNLMVCRYGEYSFAEWTNVIFLGTWLSRHLFIPMYIPTNINDIRIPTFVNTKTGEEKHEWPF